MNSSEFDSIVKELEVLLKKRENLLPDKDYELSIKIAELRNRFSRLMLESTDFNDRWIPNPNIVDHVIKAINRPVFVCGNMRSGTTMLTELLDGHSNLTVIHGDSHYLKMIERLRSVSFKEIAIESLEKYMLRKSAIFTFGKDEEKYKLLLRYWNYYCHNTDKDKFACFVMAIISSIAKNPFNIKMWIEKTPGNELYTEIAKKYYPECRHINLLRNPLDNLASLKINMHNKIKFADDRSCLVTGGRGRFYALGASYNYKDLTSLAFKNRGKYGENKYMLINYENLVNKPEMSLEKICRFLGIEFEECLKVPSEGGEPTTPNTSYRKRVHMKKGEIGINNKNKWMDTLSFYEKISIVNLLHDYAEEIGYSMDRKNCNKYYYGFVGKIFVKAHGYFRYILDRIRNIPNARVRDA